MNGSQAVPGMPGMVPPGMGSPPSPQFPSFSQPMPPMTMENMKEGVVIEESTIITHRYKIIPFKNGQPIYDQISFGTTGLNMPTNGGIRSYPAPSFREVEGPPMNGPMNPMYPSMNPMNPPMYLQPMG